MRIFLEWAKAFDLFQQLSDTDKLALLKNFAFSYNILNRVFYALNYGPGFIFFVFYRTSLIFYRII
jgi:hypothetical protein